MTLTAMREASGPLDEEILIRHENEWGFTLPADYREFLLQYNGGRPNPKFFVFKDSENGSSIHTFLGFSDEYSKSLVKKRSMFHKRIPMRFFPIAYDDGGNLICISVSGNDYGKVYFWDHDFEADTGESPETADNCTLIADEFTQFIDNLQDL